jgi:hypothetical protein
MHDTANFALAVLAILAIGRAALSLHITFPPRKERDIDQRPTE